MSGRPAEAKPRRREPHVEGVADADLQRSGCALAAEAARLARLGWMPGTSGNLSVVLSAEPLRLAVTAGGVDKGELGPADVVVVDAAGSAVAPSPRPGLVPSAEAGLHARIAQLTGAGAVVHVHALAAVVAAEYWPGGVVLRDLEMLKALGRDAHDDDVRIPVVANAQDMAVLGEAFARVREPSTPVLLVARHGLYAWGDDLAGARRHVEAADWLLRFHLATAAPGRGGPWDLTAGHLV